MNELTPSQKGAAAEAEIAAALIRLKHVVLRPVCEGGRYDLAIDTGAGILRVQCKWASRRGNVLTARCITSRHTPRGYLRSTYSAEEIDAIAVYAPDTDRCYLIPVEETEGHVTLSLRLTPTRNNQAERVRWAHDYELESSLERHWAVGARESGLGADASEPIG
ncbi:MAG TPA: group I intron-associated PD-(D/E)XK endonuclease [Solirubrobacteraceae bacterium]|nr:group I intron-associated PD-(D/E)XK endonuclease [Solirubrobacteraceae bacterium]